MSNFEKISIGLFSLRLIVLCCLALRRLVMMFNFEKISIELFSFEKMSVFSMRRIVLSC